MASTGDVKVVASDNEKADKHNGQPLESESEVNFDVESILTEALRKKSNDPNYKSEGEIWYETVLNKQEQEVIDKGVDAIIFSACKLAAQRSYDTVVTQNRANKQKEEQKNEPRDYNASHYNPRGGGHDYNNHRRDRSRSRQREGYYDRPRRRSSSSRRSRRDHYNDYYRSDYHYYDSYGNHDDGYKHRSGSRSKSRKRRSRSRSGERRRRHSYDDHRYERRSDSFTKQKTSPESRSRKIDDALKHRRRSEDRTRDEDYRRRDGEINDPKALGSEVEGAVESPSSRKSRRRRDDKDRAHKALHRDEKDRGIQSDRRYRSRSRSRNWSRDRESSRREKRRGDSDRLAVDRKKEKDGADDHHRSRRGHDEDRKKGRSGNHRHNSHSRSPSRTRVNQESIKDKIPGSPSGHKKSRRHSDRRGSRKSDKRRRDTSASHSSSPDHQQPEKRRRSGQSRRRRRSGGGDGRDKDVNQKAKKELDDRRLPSDKNDDDGKRDRTRRVEDKSEEKK